MERVRQWRAKHPGYWKRRPKAPSTLQEVLPLQVAQPEEVAPTTSQPPLQDFVASQPPLLLGLISHLVDSPLQEVVEETALRLLQKGQSILDMRFGMKPKGNTYADKETSAVRGAVAQGAGTVQLGGPAPGARGLR